MTAQAFARVFARSGDLRRAAAPEFRHGGPVLWAGFAVLLLGALALEILWVVPARYYLLIQTATRQEARRAAQRGVDRAVAELNLAGGDFSAYAWDAAGWTQRESPSNAPASGASLRRVPDPENATGDAPASGVKPLLLAGCEITPIIGLSAQANIELSAVYPDPEPDHNGNVIFRIRSEGVSEIAEPRWARANRLELALRRVIALNLRQTLATNFHGFENWTMPLAQVAEALVKPSKLSALALVAQEEVVLGSSPGWNMDSYDSRDSGKSAPNPAMPGVIGCGTYPGEGSPGVQSHCAIATNGQQVKANGAIIKGTISTHEGAVTDSQNVTGSIRSDFSRELPPPLRPSVKQFQINPDYRNGAPFPSGGSALDPFYYRIAGELGSFSVAPPSSGAKRGYVTIFVDGALKLGGSGKAYLIVPPGVICKLYVRDDIDFGEGLVNTTEPSSRMPAQLIVNGERTLDRNGSVIPKKLVATGSAAIAAVLNAPDYEVCVPGLAEWYGSIIARKYTVIGRGNGGFHYDEALDAFGKIEEFRITQYKEIEPK